MKDDDCDGRVDNLAVRTVFAEVAYGTLTSWNPSCSGGDDNQWRVCDQAIHAFCQSQACRTTGFGFVELTPSSGHVTCLAEVITREVLVAELAAFGTCSPPGVLLPPISERFACQQAIHRYCKFLGFASGYGPVGSAAANSWTVTCLKGGHAVEVETSYTALGQYVEGSCGDPASPSNVPGACRAAAKRWCAANGHMSGFGPVANGAGSATTVVCLDP